jgi:replicative DNA helicase
MTAETRSPSREFSTPLPHNIEAERGVLGAMLLDNDVIDEVVHQLKAEDFYQAGNQEIYRRALELHEAGQPVELTLLADSLRRAGKLEEVGGPMYLAGLEQSTLSIGAAPELAVIVAEKATLRRLIAAADAIQKEAREERRDVSEALDLAEKMIFEIARTSHSNNFRSTHDLMEQALEEIGRLLDNKGMLPGISTGFGELDRLLNGLQPSDLLILAARPSIGKTAFALNVAMNIAVDERRPVGIFSLEMGADQLNMRLLSSHARVGGNSVRRGNLSELQMEKLRNSAATLAAAPIYIDDSAGLNLVQVRSRARRLKAKYDNLGLIVIDYLQLMSGPESKRRDSNRQQEVSDISRGLKGLARELNVPVMALSQLSRNIEQRSKSKEAATPMLSDLRESGAIEQDADIVMFVHREREETKQEGDGPARPKGTPIPSEIIVAKHRNGPTGIANLMFFSEFTLFSNMARPS